LNPETESVYKKAAVESNILSKDPGIDYKLNVESMYFLVNTIEAKRIDNLSYYLDLEQMSCQSENLTNVQFGSKNFDVSPSTKALAVAFQDIRIKNDTRCSVTKFRSYNLGITDKKTDEGLKMNRFFINYSGQNQPQIDADPLFDVDKDYTVQRYVESLLASGSYHDSGGSETIKEFHERGSYYLFNFNKDGNDRSTRVAVNVGFDNTADVSQTRMLLFSLSSQVCHIIIDSGNISNVELEDV
jgi:hypothetical protein